jgi:hypothetical protein
MIVRNILDITDPYWYRTDGVSYKQFPLDIFADYKNYPIKFGIIKAITYNELAVRTLKMLER